MISVEQLINQRDALIAEREALPTIGLDKLGFEERIQWVRTHVSTLEEHTNQAEEPELYFKAVNAFRTALQGKPVGHTVALDSVCSGLQLMSVLTGCESGCYMTGLIDPNERTDAYTLITGYMNEALKNPISIDRNDAKRGIMTSLYGSEAVPKELFGYKTPAYYAFYDVLKQKATGAYWLLQELKAAWNPSTYAHSWVLPDGYQAYVPVMVKQETRVAIAELDYTMSVEYYENAPEERGISLCANSVHSVDAYVLRSLIRRCNYNPKQVTKVLNLLEIYLLELGLGKEFNDDYDPIMKYVNLWSANNIVDMVIINHIHADNVYHLPIKLAKQLSKLLTQVLTHEPFEVITVHDSFSAHGNHCNRLRYWYKEILAELAESTVLASILSQLYQEDIVYKPIDKNLGSKIRNSNYGLC